MLLTIHNLPAATRYADIKSLLQSKCGLQHVILDNLVGDGAGKKVTVGVVEDADAAILTRKINGLYWNGQQLYVEDVRQQKNASEQPFRVSNPQLEESPSAFSSINLQQHSSYNTKGMASDMLTPDVQPMMAAMCYVPDYKQPGNCRQVGNYMQDQNYNQAPQKVQSAYMGISGFSQTSLMTQVGMAPQINKNLHEFSQPETQSSRWRVNYNEEQDFAAKRPLFGRRSPDKRHTVNWNPNSNRRHESPPRDNSREHREPWAPRGPDNRGPRPSQPDFRPNARPDDRSGFNKPRPDFRTNDRPALLDNPDFGLNDQERRNQFSAKQHQFSERPNQRQGRANEREAFSERPRDFPGRSNERPYGFGRPNELQGRPNEHQERPNEHQGRPNEHQGRPNEHQGRPNEHQGRAYEYQRNEIFEREERPDNRPGPPRQNRSEFEHSNGREFRRLDDRPQFSRRDPSNRFSKPDRGNPKPDFPRKRKFDERFKDTKEQPSIIKPRRTQYNKPKSPTQHQMEEAKKKLSKRMFQVGLKRIMFEIDNRLFNEHTDATIRHRYKVVVSNRLKNIYNGRRAESPAECYELYRELFPASQDQETYDIMMKESININVNEAHGINAGEADEPQPKPEVLQKPPPPKLTKSEKQSVKNFKQAKQLLSQGKVPSFPQGDKKLVAQQKRENIQGHIPEVPDEFKSAIEEELDIVNALFVYELNNAPDEKQQLAFNTVDQAQLTDEIKKVLTQVLCRRILDYGLKVIRVYGHPRMPKREVLEKFLLRYGVQSLRKSAKSTMYTAAVNTFENHDRLCSLQPVPVADGNTISFKPMTSIVKRADQKALRVMRKKIIGSMVDKSDLNLLDKDWPAKQAEIKEKQAALEAAEAQRNEEKAEKVAEEAQIKAEKHQIQANEEDTPNDVENVDFTVDDIKDATNNYLDEDFHVIDEVNETDSDVEYTGGNEVVNLDDGTNDGNENELVGTVIIEHNIQIPSARENVVEIDDDENDDELCIIEDNHNQDDVDIDNIDDVNDDDLEDY